MEVSKKGFIKKLIGNPDDEFANFLKKTGVVFKLLAIRRPWFESWS